MAFSGSAVAGGKFTNVVSVRQGDSRHRLARENLAKPAEVVARAWKPMMFQINRRDKHSHGWAGQTAWIEQCTKTSFDRGAIELVHCHYCYSGKNTSRVTRAVGSLLNTKRLGPET